MTDDELPQTLTLEYIESGDYTLTTPCDHVIGLYGPHCDRAFVLASMTWPEPDDRFRYCPRCGERLEER